MSYLNEWLSGNADSTVKGSDCFYTVDQTMVKELYDDYLRWCKFGGDTPASEQYFNAIRRDNFDIHWQPYSKHHKCFE